MLHAWLNTSTGADTDMLLMVTSFYFVWLFLTGEPRRCLTLEGLVHALLYKALGCPVLYLVSMSRSTPPHSKYDI